MLSIERIEFLLLVAALVSMLVRRIRLPYTVALVVTGLILALTHAAPHVELTRDLIFNAFLPPLIFEAALNIEWPELRRDLVPILTLATVGVIVAAGVTAAGMHYAVGWAWSPALVFGVLIAATDPVSVIASMKQIGCHGRLRTLLEAESLLNDGTAAAMFVIVLQLVRPGADGLGAGAVLQFAWIAGGSVLCGGIVGGLVIFLAGRTDDHLVEITFTTICAFASFIIAEHLHLSGVISALVAGLLVGNIGCIGTFTNRGREAVVAFWDYAAFVANSLVFLLLGIREAQESFAHVREAAAIAIVAMLLGRALSVYGCSALFSRSGLRIPAGQQHVLVWGGLRGAMALALALSLPADLPGASAVRTVSFAVVAFSVIVQGLTVGPLMRRVGALDAEEPAH
jgi:CPA1 family monovalent cation:H+ antiporter